MDEKNMITLHFEATFEGTVEVAADTRSEAITVAKEEFRIFSPDIGVEDDDKIGDYELTSEPTYITYTEDKQQ